MASEFSLNKNLKCMKIGNGGGGDGRSDVGKGVRRKGRRKVEWQLGVLN